VEKGSVNHLQGPSVFYLIVAVLLAAGQHLLSELGSPPVIRLDLRQPFQDNIVGTNRSTEQKFKEMGTLK